MENFASLKDSHEGRYSFEEYKHDGYITWINIPNEYLYLEVEFTPSNERIQGQKAYHGMISKQHGAVTTIASTDSFDTFEEAEEALEDLVDEFVKGL